MSEAVLIPSDNADGNVGFEVGTVDTSPPSPDLQAASMLRSRRAVFEGVSKAFITQAPSAFENADTVEMPIFTPEDNSKSMEYLPRDDELMQARRINSIDLRASLMDELTEKLAQLSWLSEGDVDTRTALSIEIASLGTDLERLQPLSINRRRFFRMSKKAAVIALAAQIPDIWVADRIYNDSHPIVRVQTGPTIPEPLPEHTDEAYVLLPGLGADDDSAERMVQALGPHLGRNGHMISIAYPQNGLGPDCWKDTSGAFLTVLKQLGVKKVKLILHSASGVNAMNMLEAPLAKQIRMALLMGIEPPPVWQYWLDEGIDISSVSLVSSPTSSREIKGLLSKVVAETIGLVPRSALRAGLAAKFVGNVANAFTHDSYLYHSNEERWGAITRGTRSNYSPTDWLQQMHILATSRGKHWGYIYRPGVKIGTLTPSNPINDHVVETSNLSAAWDDVLELKPGTVRSLHDPTIGHGNIADTGVLKYPEQTNRAIRFARMILALERGTEYIAPEEVD